MSGTESGDANQQGDAQSDPGHPAAQTIHLPLQGNGLFLRLLHQFRNMPQLGLHAGGGDHALRASLGQSGPLVQHTAAVRQRSLRLHRIGLLADRDRFAGQRGFIDPQLISFDQPHIRRYRVAPFQQHDISRHQMRYRHFVLAAFSAHPALARPQFPQSLHRTDGFPFREKPDEGIHPCSRD